MRGSDKQIAWASEIISNIVSVLEIAAKDFSIFPGDDAIKAANIAALNDRADALRNAEYAGDVIQLFGAVRLTGDQEEDFMRVLSVYRVSTPCSEGERRILRK